MSTRPSHAFLLAAVCFGLLCAGPHGAILPELTLPTPDTNGTVQAVAVGGSYLYVGGQFSQVGGVAVSNLAAVNIFTGAVHEVWKPAVNGTVRAIYFQPGGIVYIGGEFTGVDGKEHNRVAALHAAELGEDWLIDEWKPSFTGGVVHALEYQPPRVYVGGGFTHCNEVGRNCIAAIQPAGGGSTGQLDTAWNPDVREISDFARVNAILSVGTRIIIGGRFDTVSTTTLRNNLAAFQLAGHGEARVDTTWNPSPNGEIFALGMDIGFLYVGGAYTQISGLASAKNIAAIPLGGSTGQANGLWNPRLNGNNVLAIASYGDAIYIGGQYTAVNDGIPRTNLSACAPAGNGSGGELETMWDRPALGSGVRALGTGRGRLYAGGAFHTVGGVPEANLAGFASGQLIERAAAGAHWALYE